MPKGDDFILCSVNNEYWTPNQGCIINVWELGSIKRNCEKEFVHKNESVKEEFNSRAFTSNNLLDHQAL